MMSLAFGTHVGPARCLAKAHRRERNAPSYGAGISHVGVVKHQATVVRVHLMHILFRNFSDVGGDKNVHLVAQFSSRRAVSEEMDWAMVMTATVEEAPTSDDNREWQPARPPAGSSCQ